MTQLDDKVIAITGAGSGIGRALAKRLSRRGAHLALSDVSEAGLSETVTSLPGRGRVTSHVVDVRDRQAMSDYADAAEAAHGGVDVIINNAGIAARGTIEEMSYEDLAFVVDVNLWGVMHGVKAFMPKLRKRAEGHIVNISSINAFVPFAMNGPYNAAKAAVLGVSETLMQELHGEPIRVSCVHPGGIRTNIVRNSRGFDGEQVAFFDKVARTSADSAARQIIEGIEDDRERIYVGADAKLLAAAKRLIPGAVVRWTGRVSGKPQKL